jgi:hypothetical protein
MVWFKKVFYSNITSVAYVAGPSVNTLRVQQIFPSKPNFCNLFEFPAITSTQTNILQGALKIVKWIILNLTYQELSSNMKNVPKF